MADVEEAGTTETELEVVGTPKDGVEMDKGEGDRPAIEGVPMVKVPEDGGEEVEATVDGVPTVKVEEG
jgi:hypothetical protein